MGGGGEELDPGGGRGPDEKEGLGSSPSLRRSSWTQSGPGPPSDEESGPWNEVTGVSLQVLVGVL